MDVNGANRRLLFPSQSLVHADWSPDSQHIALTVYARTHLGEAENSDSLYLVERDGSNPRLVFHSKTFLGLHAWSPDSRRIAFSVPPEDIGEPHSLYIADIDASPPRRLSDIGIDGLFVWSPDSQKIAFIDRTDQQTFQTLYLEYPLSVIDLGSQKVRNLVAGTIRGGVVHPHSPTWSPDSKQVAYASNAEDSWNIYVVDMEAVRTLGLMEVEEEGDDCYIANVAWQP